MIRIDQGIYGVGDYFLIESLITHVEINAALLGTNFIAGHAGRHDRAHQVEGRVHLHVLISPFPIDDRGYLCARFRCGLAFGWDVDDIFVAFTLNCRCDDEFTPVR